MVRHRVLARRLRGARVVLVLVGALLLAGLLLAPAGLAMSVHATAGLWTLTGWRSLPAGHTDQGVATVSLLGGRQRIVLRGNRDVSPALWAQGWRHVGDPGSARGYLVDAYQRGPSARTKLFVVTAPDGARTGWVHRLVPGEMANNSFAAVAPSGRWFVSGEWRTTRRLLVFPMPQVNTLARSGQNLPLATTIRLASALSDVQGCSFVAPTQLICTTGGPSDGLSFPTGRLVAVVLPHPVDGRPEVGRPAVLGSVPRVSGCATAETEGIDVHGNRMIVVAHERGLCSAQVDVFTYRLPSASSRPAAPAPKRRVLILGSSNANPGR